MAEVEIENKKYLDQSDLSDKEDADTLDLSPFQVDWYESVLLFYCERHFKI